MFQREKIIDDISQLAGGAAGLAASLSRQIKQDIRTRIDEIVLRMDFVPRSEFERLEALCQQLRTEQEAMKKQMQATPTKAKAKPASKPKKAAS